MTKKVFIDVATILALISYIPSDGGPSSALIESVTGEISRKEPEVFARECFPLDSNSQVDFFEKLAQESGMAVLVSNSLIIEVVYIKNPPESLAEKVIHFDAPLKGQLDEQSILKLVAEEAK
jgi:hypothetical protein